MTYTKRRFNPLYVFPLVALLFAVGAITQALDGNRTQRQGLQRFTANAAVDQEIEAARAKAEGDLAISRYESGHCLRSRHDIKPGMAIANVNPGQQICDDSGNTAITDEQGILTDFARTSDQSVIRRFIGW